MGARHKRIVGLVVEVTVLVALHQVLVGADLRAGEREAGHEDG